MGVLAPDHVQAVHRVGVAVAGEWGALDGGVSPSPHVPQDDLTRVGPSDDVARVELTDGYRHHCALRGRGF